LEKIIWQPELQNQTTGLAGRRRENQNELMRSLVKSAAYIEDKSNGGQAGERNLYQTPLYIMINDTSPIL